MFPAFIFFKNLPNGTSNVCEVNGIFIEWQNVGLSNNKYSEDEMRITRQATIQEDWNNPNI